MTDYSSIGYAVADDISIDGTMEGGFVLTIGDGNPSEMTTDEMMSLMIRIGAALQEAQALDAQ